jgi:hypothetical protein
VTNQPGLEVSYATGLVHHAGGGHTGPFFFPESLETAGANPLDYLFSDRSVALPSGGGFAENNPFSVRNADKLGVSITRGFFWNQPGLHATFTLVSWGNAHFTVPLTEGAGVLVGQGPGVGAGAPTATYVISFGNAIAPPK